MVSGMAALVAAFLLFDARSGLTIETRWLGSTPMTIFRPATGEPGPAVVISHGFAGSQQLMQPLAVTLARNGYTAITYDSLGHGRNPQPMTGDLTALDGATNALLRQLGEVVAFARTLSPIASPALVGHSMASDIVVRYAAANDIRATVALSMFSTAVSETKPANFLVIVGALEPQVLKAEALRAVELGGTAKPELRQTYGRFEDGSARRASFSANVEHIGVLYSAESLAETTAWLDQAFGRFGRNGKLAVDRRGWLLAALFGGLIVLAYPLAHLLPRLQPVSPERSRRWGRFILPALAPAILTPLILWKMPTSFLPILLGDYLTLHFGLYGLLTALLIILQSRRGAEDTVEDRRLSASANIPATMLATTIATLAVAAYASAVIGFFLDEFVVSFAPVPARLPTIAAIFLGTLPYFLADEWLARRTASVPGAYLLTKICFACSLAAAVALNLEKLFFLIIIIPVIVIFFVVYGLFSRWAHRRTGVWAVGAIANAIAFAYAIGVTFPLVSR
ncbi:MAG: alpha/beta hydrolase [Beijerinckiaceae bacterium]|nr:alpha/beta hydrolase [Beijerinckiaceae bacterium]